MSHRAQTPSPSNEEGWALVELLIAIALLAMLMTLLAAAAQYARRGLIFLGVQGERERIEAVETYLRKTLSQAYPATLPGRRSGEPLIDTFEHGVTFLSSYTPQGQYSGLYVITLSVRRRSESGILDLVEQRTLFRPEPQPDAPEPVRPSTATVLIPGVGDVDYAYFGALELNQAPSWHATWTVATRLPLLVSINVRFAGGDQRHWVPLTVALPTGR